MKKLLSFALALAGFSAFSAAPIRSNFATTNDSPTLTNIVRSVSSALDTNAVRVLLSNSPTIIAPVILAPTLKYPGAVTVFDGTNVNFPTGASFGPLATGPMFWNDGGFTFGSGIGGGYAGLNYSAGANALYIHYPTVDHAYGSFAGSFSGDATALSKATTNTAGVVRVDGITMIVSQNGTISAVASNGVAVVSNLPPDHITGYGDQQVIYSPSASTNQVAWSHEPALSGSNFTHILASSLEPGTALPSLNAASLTNLATSATNVVWVSKRGNDSWPGTESQPCLTISNALSRCGISNGLVHVTSGVYTEADLGYQRPGLDAHFVFDPNTWVNYDVVHGKTLGVFSDNGADSTTNNITLTISGFLNFTNGDGQLVYLNGPRSKCRLEADNLDGSAIGGAGGSVVFCHPNFYAFPEAASYADPVLDIKCSSLAGKVWVGECGSYIEASRMFTNCQFYLDRDSAVPRPIQYFKSKAALNCSVIFQQPDASPAVFDVPYWTFASAAETAQANLTNAAAKFGVVGLYGKTEFRGTTFIQQPGSPGLFCLGNPQLYSGYALLDYTNAPTLVFTDCKVVATNGNTSTLVTLMDRTTTTNRSQVQINGKLSLSNVVFSAVSLAGGGSVDTGTNVLALNGAVQRLVGTKTGRLEILSPNGPPQLTWSVDGSWVIDVDDSYLYFGSGASFIGKDGNAYMQGVWATNLLSYGQIIGNVGSATNSAGVTVDNLASIGYVNAATNDILTGSHVYSGSNTFTGVLQYIGTNATTTVSNLVVQGTLTMSNAYPAITFSQQVSNPNGTTNLLMFVGGVCVSNIANYHD